MITEDTVDADIYRMQERKAKMNAAILEDDAKKKKKKGKEEGTKTEIDQIVNMAIAGFESRKRS